MSLEINKTTEGKEVSVQDKLKMLYELQTVVSEIDKINTLRGELPLEVQDLEDEIVGLKTRLSNLQDEIKNLNAAVANKKLEIKDAKNKIDRYKEQQDNVRNNREFDAISKEMEFQTLEIELAEKRIREYTNDAKVKGELLDASNLLLKEREDDLIRKKKELEEITAETALEEEQLKAKTTKISAMIEERLLTAFNKIRKNARNGLSVVTVQRDACGGCFNKIPPQRQLDIASRKKIIVCEYCGRILVDKDISSQQNEEN
ncbi:MAG: C4-type zinc ribbon domain-containing protein [Marinilabiliales bacterium]|nr:C4-type zinc ribbon domain-containing protein [Marinilabiliales bacterium]